MKLKFDLSKLKLRSLPKARPGKTWVVLGVAVGIGCLAALAARSYLNHQVEAIEARAKVRSTTVIVAKVDMAKGTRLSTDNLALREIPEEFAHSVAIRPENFDRIDGQTLAFAVKGGEMILWGLLDAQKAPTFSAKVEAGRRAITVPVDEINSISGMLEPGDSIDLMVTLDQQGKKVTFPLLQSARVMATGQRSVDDPKSGERRSFSTVTLDTTPEQAQNVIVARDAGKITALLRNPGDNETIGKTGYDVAALLGQSATPTVPPLLPMDAAPALAGRLAGLPGIVAPAGKIVPVLYGGSPERLAAETQRARAPGADQPPPSSARLLQPRYPIS